MKAAAVLAALLFVLATAAACSAGRPAPAAHATGVYGSSPWGWTPGGFHPGEVPR